MYREVVMRVRIRESVDWTNGSFCPKAPKWVNPAVCTGTKKGSSYHGFLSLSLSLFIYSGHILEVIS